MPDHSRIEERLDALEVRLLRILAYLETLPKPPKSAPRLRLVPDEASETRRAA